MSGPFTTPVAESVPLENRDSKDNDFKALNLQDALEEIDFRRETKEPTGFLNRYRSHISFDDASRTLTITPLFGSYKYFIWGEEFVIDTAKSVVLDDAEGLWMVYFDNTGELHATQNLDYNFFLEKKTSVAAIYWDADSKKAISTLEERHGLAMDYATHMRLHYVVGAEIGKGDFGAYNYLLREDGSLNSHAEIAFKDGVFFDEDIAIQITDTASPTEHHQQELGPIAKIPVYHIHGTELDPVWRKVDASDVPLFLDSGNTPFYSKLVGGNWTQTNVSNDHYIAQVICVTGDINNPLICLNSVSESQSAAEAAIGIDISLRASGAPFSELKPIEYVIYQCSSNYSNDYGARLVGVLSAGEVRTIKDRYVMTVSYGGNANTGRVLDAVGAVEDTEEQPILIPEDSFIRTITLQATANIPVGRSIGFYDIDDLGTPLFEIAMPVSGDHYTFNISEFVAADTELAIRVTRGSMSKPVVRFWIETINI